MINSVKINTTITINCDEEVVILGSSIMTKKQLEKLLKNFNKVENVYMGQFGNVTMEISSIREEASILEREFIKQYKKKVRDLSEKIGGRLMSIIINDNKDYDEQYHGLFLDRRLSKEERLELEKEYDVFELREEKLYIKEKFSEKSEMELHKMILEDEIKFEEAFDQVKPSIANNILVDFWGSFIVPRKNLILKEEAIIEYYCFLDTDSFINDRILNAFFSIKKMEE